MQAGLWLSSVFPVCGSTIFHSCVLLLGRGVPQICSRKHDQCYDLPLWGSLASLTVLVCPPECGEWGAET